MGYMWALGTYIYIYMYITLGIVYYNSTNASRKGEMLEKMVDRSTEVDINECCMIDRSLSTIRHSALTSVDLHFHLQLGVYAINTRDMTEHCGNIGGEVQYGYKVTEPGITLGIVIQVLTLKI